MKRLAMFLALTACEERTVTVHAPNGTSVTVSTDNQKLDDKSCVDVNIKSTAPSIVPLMIPMPIPFAKTPITAEKPAP